jgi:uncharacterized membrane protein YjfL (UPF0719 family)
VEVQVNQKWEGSNMQNTIIHLQEYFLSLFSSEWMWDLVALDLVLIIGILFLFKKMVGFYSGVNVINEVSEKDNSAFGMVLGSMFLGFFITMSAVTTGDELTSYKQEVILVLSYGISAIFMLLSSKLIFDKISMSKFHILEELNKGNKSVALVDSGNILSTALIVFAYMSWVKGVNLNSIAVVFYGWFLSQVSLSALTYIRAKMYKEYDGKTLIDSIIDDNQAVALRFFAYRIVFAFTPIIALSHYPFEEDYTFLLATEIFMTSIILFVLFVLFTSITKKVLFSSVDFKDEINKQRNFGVAFIESSIIIGYALFFFGLLK